jgi:hypothetical protein
MSIFFCEELYSSVRECLYGSCLWNAVWSALDLLMRVHSIAFRFLNMTSLAQWQDQCFLGTARMCTNFGYVATKVVNQFMKQSPS